MTVTAKALSRLKKRRDTATTGYQKTVRAALGRYSKTAKDVFDRSVQRRTNLLQVRQAEEATLQRDRESFFLATRNVLSKETLDYLKGLSNIAAPTLTSIFTGFESARADEAAREERLLDEREESIERLQRDRELTFREAGAADRALLSAEGRVADQSLSSAGRVFSEQGQNDRLIAREVIGEDQAQRQQAFSRQERLARQSFQSAERLATQAAIDARQEDSQEYQNQVRQAQIELDAQLTKAKTEREAEALKLAHQRKLEQIKLQNKGRTSRKTSNASQFIFSKSPDYEVPVNTAPVTQSGTLANVIASGEGDYQSFNRGNAGDSAGSKIDFSQMTVGDVMDRQALPQGHPDRVFAVGRYQITPATMNEAVKALGIDEKAPLTPELQDKIFSEYLVKDKRPAIRDYITGRSDNLLEAQRAGSLEFASIADPTTGQTAYPNVGNNRASIASDAFGASLQSARKAYQDAVNQGIDPGRAYSNAVGIFTQPEPEPPATAKAVEKEAATVTQPPEPEPTPPEELDLGPAAAVDVQQNIAQQDNEQEIQEIQETIAEFQDQEDPTEALRVAAQEQAAQNEQLKTQLAAISENPTIEEMQTALDESDEEDERLKRLLAAANYNQALLNQGGVS